MDRARRPRWLSTLLVGALVASGCNLTTHLSSQLGVKSPAPVAPATRSPLAPVQLSGSGNLRPFPAGPTPLAVASATPGPGPALQASLTGVVLAPDGILSDNGGGVISNNGGSVIGNNGASLTGNSDSPIIGNNGGTLVEKTGFRTLALAQAPLANARVYLLDAQGRPIRGADGQAVHTQTDAQGRYAFAGDLPSHNLLLAVQLAGGKGLWQAILPKDAPAPRRVNLDLISTLSTGYILNKYVATQSDFQATLDRLPGAAEADARAKAAAAYDRAGGKVPDSFSPAATVNAVDALRKQDDSLDAQMELIRRLLIAAGQSDLGAGQPADQTRFGRMSNVVPLPDGSFWFCAQDDGRIWSVDPAGKLHVLVGSGVAGGTPPADGQLATESSPSGPGNVVRDGHGRVVFTDGDKLFRVGADGRLSLLWDNMPNTSFVLAGPGDEIWVGTNDGKAVYRAGLGQPATPMGPIPSAPPPHWGGRFGQGGLPQAPKLVGAGRGGDGRLYLLRSLPTGSPGALEESLTGSVLDPVTGTETPAAAVVGKLIAITSDGAWVSLETDGSLRFTPSAGAPSRFALPELALLPTFDPFGALAGNQWSWFAQHNLNFAHAADGRGYVFTIYELHELDLDGKVRHIAGLDPARIAQGGANQVSLDQPTGAAFGPDGALYVTDNSIHQVVRRDASNQISHFSGVGGWQAAILGSDRGQASLQYGNSPAIAFGVTYTAKANDARYVFPSLIRADAAGNVFVIDSGSFVRKLAPNGDLASLYASIVGHGVAIPDILPRPDGTLLVAQIDKSALHLFPVGLDGLISQPLPVSFPSPPACSPDPDNGNFCVDANQLSTRDVNLALGADGTVYVRMFDTVYTLNGNTLAPLVSDPRFEPDSDGDGDFGNIFVRMAVDARGRVYITGNTQLLRWTPGRTAVEVLAGPGGRLLSGATPDTSLQRPLSPVFDAGGNLYVVDRGNKQVKRIAADQL